MATKAGLHTIRALQAAAAELNAKRATPKVSFARKVNEAHRSALGQSKKEKEQRG
jgi:hypothetical protein